MKISDVENSLRLAGFSRTNFPLTLPLVVHGVPGCGKSTFILGLLDSEHVTARTLGAAYGDSLAHCGVPKLTAHTFQSSKAIRVLDEYQLAQPSQVSGFNVVIGDPYQGPLRLPAHYVKKVSHRVPEPVTAFLRTHKFEITSDVPGTLTRRGIGFDGPVSATVLHLGSISKAFVHRHGLCSRSPSEVRGLEFDEVTLVYHSSERQDFQAFYVATTRARHALHLVSEEFHELSTAT